MALKQTPKAEVDTSITLTLALYEVYQLRGETFKKGVPYKFNLKTAMELLGEMDCNRRVWQKYRAPAPVVQKIVAPKDVTAVEVDFDSGDPLYVKSTTIVVGNDDELKELLDSSNDVEV